MQSTRRAWRILNAHGVLRGDEGIAMTPARHMVAAQAFSRAEAAAIVAAAAPMDSVNAQFWRMRLCCPKSVTKSRGESDRGESAEENPRRAHCSLTAR